MRFAIAFSRKDTAGINIVSQIKKIAFIPDIPIIELSKETIYSDDLDKHPELKEVDFLVFASKHKSEKNEKSLTLHAPGNFRSADFGGKPGKVCNTSAFVLKYLFQKLNENYEEAKINSNSIENYNITLECTHHGPLINKPCCFIEIGSSENEWKDENAGKVIAKTILSLQKFNNHYPWISCIGLGGPHYAPNFNKIQLSSNYAISHIIPEYQLPLTEAMLREAEEKTQEQVQLILLDWKGLGNSEQKQTIIDLLNKLHFKHLRTGSVEK